jgi:hypothetical protein
MICLIPKKEDALAIKDYKPVKITTRVLITRLEGGFGRLIHPTQTAFLKGRYIMDGIVTA